MPVITTNPTVIDIQDDAGLSSARRQTIERITTSDGAVVILSTDQNIEVNTYEDAYTTTEISQFNVYNNAAGVDGAVQIRSGDQFGSANGLLFNPVSNALFTPALRTNDILYANGLPWVVNGGNGITVQVNGSTVIPSNVTSNGTNVSVVSWNSDTNDNGVLFSTPGDGAVQASLDLSGNYSFANLALANGLTIANTTFRDSATVTVNYQLPVRGPEANAQLLAIDSSDNQLYWANADTTRIANGNSSISIPSANSPIRVSVANNSNLVVFNAANTQFNVPVLAGNGLTVNSNSTTDLTASQVRLPAVANIKIANPGNISAGYALVLGSTTTGVADLTFANLASITGNLSVTGTATIGGNVQSSNFSTGNITASSNISGLNLTVTNSAVISNALTVTGNLLVTGARVSLGNVGNISIVGGANGQYLQTDGSGNLNWEYISTSIISNGNSSVSVVGNSNVIIRVENTDRLVIANTGVVITGTANVSGNLTAGNISATGVNGNSGTFAALTVTGNASVGNNLTATRITATANITANNITANANITANNVSASNVTVTATANFNSFVNFTNVGNLRILGGNTGQFLSTNGSGNLTWQFPNRLFNGNSGIQIPVSDGNINFQVNSAPILNLSSNLSNFSSNTQINGTLTVTNTITGWNGVSFYSANTNNSVTLRSASNTNAYSLTLPSNAGSNGQVLSTNGTGGLSWITNNQLANGNSSINIVANSNITLNPSNTTVLTANSVTGVTVNGNLAAVSNVTFTGANVNLGNVSNLHISGGTANYVLTTNGLGNLTWRSGTFVASITAIANDNYDILVTDDVIAISTPANTTITLPAASANLVGKYFIIKDVLGDDRPNNVITVQTSDTLDGANSYTITEPYNSITVACLSETTWGII